jgi:hypothetical protein
MIFRKTTTSRSDFSKQFRNLAFVPDLQSESTPVASLFLRHKTADRNTAHPKFGVAALPHPVP